MDNAAFAGWATALVSAGALFFSYRADRSLRKRDDPIIEVDLHPIKQIPGWLEVRFIVRNQTNISWNIVSVQARPGGVAAIVPERLAFETTKAGYMQVSSAMLEANAATGPIQLGYKVNPAGSPKTIGLIGDTLHHSVFLSLRKSQRAISIRLILRSMEAKPRSMTIEFTRRTSELKAMMASAA